MAPAQTPTARATATKRAIRTTTSARTARRGRTCITKWHIGVGGHRSGVEVAAENVERDLYMRIKRWYHDLLRANGQDVSEDDSEASSGDIDGEEDASTKADRRQRREAKRDETTRRIKRLKADGGVPKEYDNVDVVTEWMDRQGHILSVSIHLAPRMDIELIEQELKWMEDLQEQSRRLEFEGNRDE